MNFSLEKMTPMSYKETVNVSTASIADVKRYSYICIQLINERAMGVVSERTTNSNCVCVDNPTARFLFGGIALSNQEFITPVVFPPKPVIYKVEKEDGSRKYCCAESRGNYRSLNVVEIDLESYFDMIFDHLSRLVMIFDDGSLDSHYFILGTVIRHFNSHIKELDHFIRQNVGVIQVETIDDEIVGVSVKPIDKNR